MMGFERLTARNKNGLAYLVNVKPNEQEVDSPHKNTLKCILDCFERLAQYEEEAITALQACQTKEPCDYCKSGIDTVSLMDSDMVMRFVRPVSYCPDCGRKLDREE